MIKAVTRDGGVAVDVKGNETDIAHEVKALIEALTKNTETQAMLLAALLFLMTKGMPDEEEE